MPGLPRDRLPIACDGSLILCEFSQDCTAVEVGVRVVRSECDGSLIAGNGSLGLREGTQRIAEVVVSKRVSRIGPQRPAEQLDGTLWLLCLKTDHCKIDQGMKMLRLPLQHLLIEDPGLIETPLLMQSERLLEACASPR